MSKYAIKTLKYMLKKSRWPFFADPFTRESFLLRLYIFLSKLASKHPWLRQRLDLEPVITSRFHKGREGSPTFVMVCGSRFDQTVSNASTCVCMGFCRGFAEIGCSYKLISVFDLAKEIPSIENPIIFLSTFHYPYLGKKEITTLKEFPHFVWAVPWFKDFNKFRARYPYLARWGHYPQLAKLVPRSEPAFVFAPVPPSCLSFYEGYENHGVKLVSLPLACDTTIYHPPSNPSDDFADVCIAYVGGYRDYKAISFEKYLRPYERQLTVYGYDPWPYSSYRGKLAIEDEHRLYYQATLSPAISEPHCEIMGDITERVFKILGSGGMAITDVSPAYRELFSEDELLVPNSVDEYHELVQRVLSDENLRAKYRKKGHKAVMERHTYACRARTILRGLDLKIPKL